MHEMHIGDAQRARSHRRIIPCTQNITSCVLRRYNSAHAKCTRSNDVRMNSFVDHKSNCQDVAGGKCVKPRVCGAHHRNLKIAKQELEVTREGHPGPLSHTCGGTL